MLKYKNRNPQRGLTLIELLLATALGLVILTAAFKSMNAMMKSNNIQQSLNNMQKTSDIALSYIGFRFRNAMSTPCAKINSLQSVNINTLSGAGSTLTALDENKITGLIEGKGIRITQSTVNFTGINVTNSNNTTITNVTTDDISLITAKDKLIIDGQTGVPEPGSKMINIVGHFPVANNDNGALYAISDCKTMDVFQAARNPVGTPAPNTTRTTLTTNQNTDMATNYRAVDGAMVSRLTATTLGVDASGNLFDHQLFGSATVDTLTGNIELMRVLFGVDKTNNGNVDSYITASQLNTLPTEVNVVGAEVFLLVRSEMQGSSIPVSYTLSIPDTSAAITNSGEIPQQTLTVTDQIMRRVFSRSVTFRNKIAM